MANVIDKVAGLVVGPQGPQGPQGPKGDTGQTGPQGATGATPNLTIGTVTTLDPDDDATATITGTAANPVLNLGIPKGDTGEVSQAEFDEVAGDVSQLKSFKGSIFTENPIAVDINNISGITTKTGWNAQVNQQNKYILIEPLSGFDTYYFITDIDVDIWIDGTTPQYFAICTGETLVSTESGSNAIKLNCASNCARYRNIDSNLPTESNKLHVSAGSPISFTVTAGKMMSVYGLSFGKKINSSFSNDVFFKRNVHIKYESGSFAQAASEKLHVYVPTISGFTDYVFAHSVANSYNCDVWRMSAADHVSDDFVKVKELTASGEWECALHIQGRDDFSGGYMHGDEVLTDVTFLINGKPTDITQFTDVTQIKTIEVIETSNLYDPADHTTVIAKHGSAHIWTVDGMTIRQSIEWVIDVNLSNGCYLAMFPVSKSVSQNLIIDKSYQTYELTGSDQFFGDTQSATIYSGDASVLSKFDIYKYPNLGEQYTFLTTDNGNGDYNKCYYIIQRSTTTTVSVGTIWKAESFL